jgi:hypothetical protein
VKSASWLTHVNSRVKSQLEVTGVHETKMICKIHEQVGGIEGSIHASAKENAIVQSTTNTIKIQDINLNLGVVKMRLYMRRTLTLVIPTAGHVKI